MFKAAAAILATSLLTASSAAQGAPNPQPDPDPQAILGGMVDLYSPGVVEVAVRLPPQENGQAGDEPAERTTAGFFIGAGKLLTIRSAVLGGEEGRVLFDNGTRLPIKSVLAEDLAADLVILNIDVPPALRRGLRISYLEPIEGEDVAIIGRPTETGIDEPVHDLVGGTLASPRRIDTPSGAVPVFQVRSAVDDDTWRRLAGSPLVNGFGQVVGVVVATLGENGPSRIAVDPTRLLRMEETQGLALARWSRAGSLKDVPSLFDQEEEEVRLEDLPRAEGFPAPPETFEGYRVVPAAIQVGEEGHPVLDGRFPLKGSGTAADPYQISWDLLLSASETLVPRVGRKRLPERITLLDGKYVRINGNLMLPMMMDMPDEVQVMLNPWDGCCLGVPPTPYDAVEVRLRKALEGDDRMATYGTVTGRLSVKPYLIGDWLVGLYVMEDASLQVQRYGGFGF